MHSELLPWFELAGYVVQMRLNCAIGDFKNLYSLPHTGIQ